MDDREAVGRVLAVDDEEQRLMKALAAYGEHVVALAELELEGGMR